MAYDEGELLSTELAPKRTDELHIHNKKLAEVTHWLKNVFSEPIYHSGVLYLTGPTGSGKSTTVKVICKERNIELIEYEPEVLHNENLELENPDVNQLIQFLKKRHGCLNKGSKKRVLFVKELPDQVYQNAEEFRDKLSDALHYIRHPVIFCLTNNLATWNLNPDRFFTKFFLVKNGIDTIVFNPIADSFMKKALNRVSNLMRSPLSDAKLNAIRDEARGDLRVALNMLQMNSIGSNADRRSGKKLICASKSNKEEAFQMIGRILYAKRINPNSRNSTGFGKKRKKFSLNIYEPTERTDLEHDPTDIIMMSSMTSDNLINFLFENEHVFCSDIPKYRHVAEFFSFCDAFAGDWSTKRSLPDEYVSQIITRNIMWNNFKGSRPKILYAVARPQLKELEKHIISTKNEIRRLPMIGASDFNYLTAPYLTIIENIVDPHRIENFISRPMTIYWNKGKEGIEEMLERTSSLYFQGRRKPRKSQYQMSQKRRFVTEENKEKETFTIEDSSDDSFDNF